MKTPLVALCALALGVTAGGVAAQDVVVPQVTTASPGGYAQPLQLDTDRYKREQAGQRRTQGGTQQPATRNAQPSQAEINALMRRLAPEYHRRVQRDGEQAALVWIRQAAFEAGQEAKAHNRR